MLLQDYVKAIHILMIALAEKQYYICFESIAPSYDGNRFVFSIDKESYYVVDIHNGRVVKNYNDTWRNPEHMEVLCEGNK